MTKMITSPVVVQGVNQGIDKCNERLQCARVRNLNFYRYGLVRWRD